MDDSKNNDDIALKKQKSLLNSPANFDLADYLHEDYCFLCNQKGDGHEKGIVLCEFQGCPKAYHYHCLGNFAPNLGNCAADSSASEKQVKTRWFCPWHYCAVCSIEDKEDTSYLKSKPFPSKVFKTNEVEFELTDHGVESSLAGKQPDVKEPVKFVKFFRCLTCPLALCSRCVDSPRQIVNHLSQIVIPTKIKHTIKKGFFRCVYCQEECLSEKKDKFYLPPQISLAKLLIKVWSRLVNWHFRIMKPFLHRPSTAFLTSSKIKYASESIKHEIISLNESVISPKSLAEIRDDIYTCKYRNVEEFAADVKGVQNHMALIFNSGNDETLTQAINSIAIFLDDALQPFIHKLKSFDSSKPLEVVGSLTLDVKKYEAYRRLSDNLFPSLRAMQRSSKYKYFRSSYAQDEINIEMSPEDWGNEIQKAPGLDNVSANFEQNKAEFAKSGIFKMFNTLLDAVDIVEKNGHVEPVETKKICSELSSDEFSKALNDQTICLHKALSSIDKVRVLYEEQLQMLSLTAKESNTTEAATEESSGAAVMTLGELSVAAEFKLANRHLRSQNKILVELLELERQKRKDLEEELRQLKTNKSSSKGARQAVNKAKQSMGNTVTMTLRKSTRFKSLLLEES